MNVCICMYKFDAENGLKGYMSSCVCVCVCVPVHMRVYGRWAGVAESGGSLRFAYLFFYSVFTHNKNILLWLFKKTWNTEKLEYTSLACVMLK